MIQFKENLQTLKKEFWCFNLEIKPDDENDYILFIAKEIYAEFKKEYPTSQLLIGILFNVQTLLIEVSGLDIPVNEFNENIIKIYKEAKQKFNQKLKQKGKQNE